MFHGIGNQEQGCCELVLGFQKAQGASLEPQDWAQMTFCSEIISNGLNNDSGRLSAERKKLRYCDFSMMYSVSQN